MSGEVKLAEAELVERVAIIIRDHEVCSGADTSTGLHRELAEEIFAAIEATRPPVVTGQDGEGGWQGIESAPFDRSFLAAIHHGESYVVCQARRTKAGVFDTMEDSCVGWRPHPAYKPAFWRPLPAFDLAALPKAPGQESPNDCG